MIINDNNNNNNCNGNHNPAGTPRIGPGNRIPALLCPSSAGLGFSPTPPTADTGTGTEDRWAYERGRQTEIKADSRSISEISDDEDTLGCIMLVRVEEDGAPTTSFQEWRMIFLVAPAVHLRDMTAEIWSSAVSTKEEAGVCRPPGSFL